jgi:hypothetical protein
MKPMFQSPTGQPRFPLVDHFFQSRIDGWRGYSSPFDDDDRSEWRKFHDFNRAFLIEAARERAREMAVFALVVAASAWPVIYMIITVVKLLLKGRPLTE